MLAQTSVPWLYTVFRPSTVVSTCAFPPLELLALARTLILTINFRGLPELTENAACCGDTERFTMFVATTVHADELDASRTHSRRCSSYQFWTLFFLMRHWTQRSPDWPAASRVGALAWV